MPTARDIITASFDDLNLWGAGESIPGDDMAQALVRLNRLVSNLGTQKLSIFYEARVTWSIIAGTQTYTLGTGGVINVARPLWVPRAGFLNTAVTPNQELPVAVWTPQQWDSVTIKAQTSPWPQAFFPDFNFPLTGASAGMMTLTVWPVTTSNVTGVLYLPQALTQFADLSTSYSFPPGYEDLLEYLLCRRLAGPYHAEIAPDIRALGDQALATVKRANRRLVTMRLPVGLPGLMPSGSTVYNIDSDL